MKIFYKDYEYPSFEINDHGYLLPNKYNDDDYNNIYRNEISDYIIKPENNISYFGEADILTKINLNEEKYFNFNKAIIDIGSHVGVYSFRSNFKKGYLFEPNEKISIFAKMNLIMHDKFDNFKVYNVLLSDNNEPVKYDGFNNEFTFNESLEDSLKKLDFNNEYYKIQTITPHILDEYNCKDVGLIKIDVEGMEEKVLRGGIGTIIRNNYPPILFELWDVDFSLIKNNEIVNYSVSQEKHDSLQKFLEDLGYKILWYWGDNETHLAIHE